MRRESKTGAQEESYYLVKFQNNPQGARILVNELPGTCLAARMGLPFRFRGPRENAPAPFAPSKLVRQLLISAWKSLMQPFPNWK
jgi:hypothetical protein